MRTWRRGTRPMLAGLALALVLSAWFASQWWHAERWNAAIAAGEGFDKVAAAAARPARAASAAASAQQAEGDAASAAASAPAVAAGPVASDPPAPVPAASPVAATGPGDAASARAAPAAQTSLSGVVEAASAAASGAVAPAWLNDGRPLHWRFAHAHHLAEGGDLEGALARYRSLYDDPELGLAARYNSGNALLRAALAAREAEHPAQALVLLELAKEAFRAVLRLDPGHWDARYNLERVQRLQPDPSAEDMAGAEPPKAAERAATTMRGTSRGLP